MVGIPIIVNTNNTGLVTMSLRGDGHKLVFIIDTGSNESHIDEEATKLLKSPIDKTAGSKITGVSGSLKSIGKIDQWLEYKTHSFKLGFSVTDLSAMVKAIEKACGVHIHGIIGTDFLRIFDGRLDFKDSMLYLI